MLVEGEVFDIAFLLRACRGISAGATVSIGALV